MVNNTVLCPLGIIVFRSVPLIIKGNKLGRKDENEKACVNWALYNWMPYSLRKFPSMV